MVDRSTRPTPAATAPGTDGGVSAPVVAAAPALPGAENAGKPGYYTVQRGETLTRIGLDNGQSWRDLVRWNNLSNPDLIEAGQVLRVSPPGAAVEAQGVVVRPVTAGGESSPTVSAAKPATTPAATAAADEGLGHPAEAALRHRLHSRQVEG